MLHNLNKSSKLLNIKSLLSILFKNPFLFTKFMLKSVYHQTKNLISDPLQIYYLTDSEKVYFWEKFAYNVISTKSLKHAKRHNLDTPLIVSLTSYPKRFKILHFALQSLLSQTVVPDKLLLWISHSDKSFLTQKILDLQDKGLEIKYCEDFGSYKKIIPTLKHYPDSAIVTADDDLYYWPTWLEELLESWSGDQRDVVAHRIHKIKLEDDGSLKKYSQWNIDDVEALSPSILNFPTSGGGVLYPAGTFHDEVTNDKVFQEMCRNCDDIWLYWMARLNGAVFRKVSASSRLLVLPNSQENALWNQNVNYKNDLCINELIHKYGFPQG